MMNVINKIALALIIVGALNWGLVGLFSFDLVAWITGGAASILARIIYTIIALAGIFSVSMLFLDMDDYAEHRAWISEWIQNARNYRSRIEAEEFMDRT